MPSKFAPGATVHNKDGRVYIVDMVEDGVVYCRTDGGAETEFAEAALFTEAEWAAKSGGRHEQFYGRLKQSKVYAQAASAHANDAAATPILLKLDKLSPGILDYIAFTSAVRVLRDNGDDDLGKDLSVVKCRAAFDGAPAGTRLALAAFVLALTPAALLDAGRLGDNLMRALIEKGIAPQMDAFDEFLDRPRR